jgi:hypothetical protein
MDRDNPPAGSNSGARAALTVALALVPPSAVLGAWMLSAVAGPPDGLIDWKRSAFWSGMNVTYLFRAVSQPASMLALVGILGSVGVMAGFVAPRIGFAGALVGFALVVLGAASATACGFYAGRLHPLDVFAVPMLFGRFSFVGAAMLVGVALGAVVPSARRTRGAE